MARFAGQPCTKLPLVLLLGAVLALMLFASAQSQPLTEPTVPPQGCLKSEFQCSDGTCISDAMHCDGKFDCPGGLGEDEAACSVSIPSCSANKLFCGALDGDCVELLKVCDGVQDCILSGRDEEDCPSIPGAVCLGSQFECVESDVVSSVTGSDCIPLRERCDSAFQCADGADELGCTLPTLTQPPQSQAVMAGVEITLTCEAEGTPTPTITWLRNLMPLPNDSRYKVTSVGGVGTLTISQATVFDQGDFSCEVSIPTYSFVSKDNATVSVTNDNPGSCLDSSDNTYLEGERFYTIDSHISGSAQTAAADVVFVVDESGSMDRAQDWIREMAPLLDTALTDIGVGAGDVPNHFALVGFGRPNPDTNAGLVLSQLDSVTDFVRAANNLALNGSIEDGYSAIELALDQIQLRGASDIARVMILATDEDRQALVGKQDLTRDAIEQRLRDAGFVLNVVVRQEFLKDPGNVYELALGMDFNGTCYVYNSEMDAVVTSSCVKSTGFGSTYEDYVQLAFNLEGAAWDISFLSQVPDFTAFSESFITVKVDEVMGLLRYCLACTCHADPPDCQRLDDIALKDCQGQAPAERQFVVTLSPNPVSDVPVGTSVTLTCNIFIFPEVPEDEITVVWERMGGVFPCNQGNCPRSITLADIQASSEGLYSCVVTVGGETERAEAYLSVVASPVILSPPNDTTAREGKPLEVECVANGIPSPLVYWVRTDGQPLPNSAIVEGTGTSTRLVIDPADLADSGQYKCVAINKAGMDNASFTIQVGIAGCNVSDTLMLLLGESQIIFSHEPAVDLVLLVDESGSMETEHDWLKRMVKQLDEMLKRYNVGVLRPNLFSVIGYGSPYQNSELGRIVSTGAQFVPSEDIDSLIDDDLWVDGCREDGYAAIKFAFDNLGFRDDTAKQFILVTDEHRYELDSTLDYDSVRDMLVTKDTRLNVIVQERFEGYKNAPAMGIDSLGNAYVYFPPSVNQFPSHPMYSDAPANLAVRVVDGGRSVPDSGYKTTHEDYTRLALEVGGASWNLGMLSMGPPTAYAFSAAFVRVETQEILNQVGICQNCSCSDAGLQCINLDHSIGNYSECSIPQFEDLVPPLDTVLSVTIQPRFHRFRNYGDQNTSLECHVDRHDPPYGYGWTFRGRQLEPNRDVSTYYGESSVLTLVNPTSANTGWYSCFAVEFIDNSGISFLVGVTGLETAYVEVQEPFIVMEPLRSEVDIGDNVALTATLTEDGTFTWFYWSGDPNTETEPLPSNAVVESTSRKSTLTIENADESNTGVYTCKGAGSTQSGSDYAQVFVSEPELKISLGGDVHGATLGLDESVLRCEVDCNCQDVQLVWETVDGSDFPTGAMAQDGTLMFSHVRLEFQQQYRCIATYGAQQRSKIVYFKVTPMDTDPLPQTTSYSVVWPTPTSSLTLQPPAPSTSSLVAISPTPSSSSSLVITSPTPSPRPRLPLPVVSPSPVVTSIDSSIEVSCTTDVPNANITWHLAADDSAELPEGIVTTMTSPITSTLRISSVTREHFTTYICRVSNGSTHEPASREFIIHEHVVLRTPTVAPDPARGPIEVEPGFPVTVNCTTNAPYSKITWKRLHSPHRLPAGIVTERIDPLISQLRITVMENSMYAQYVCEVTTHLGDGPLATVFTISRPDPIRVAVTVPADAFPTPENVITEDNLVVVQCAFTCMVCTGAELSWSFNGRPLPPGVRTKASSIGRTMDLEFFDGSADQSGLYVCSAFYTNGTEAHNATFNATILVTARVWVPSRSKTIPQGETAVFQCHSSRSAEFEWHYQTVEGSLPDSATPETISETESRLTITNVMHDENTGKYFCTGKFVGTEEILKADADLSEKPDLSVDFELLSLEGSLDEASVTVSSGDAVDVKCSLSCGALCPTATVSWLDDDLNEISTSPSSPVRQERPGSRRFSTLKIDSASDDNTGEYICRAIMSAELMTDTPFTITLS